MRKLTLLLSIVLIFSLFTPMETTTANTLHYETQAEKLNAINIMRGSDKGFELERQLSRVEGSVMLVRLLGEEDEALENNFPHPFNDVPGWADAYVGYLYEEGLTKGTSPTTFGARDNMTAMQYSTFILRAIGYDDSKGDFVWNQSVQKAREIGLINAVEQNRLTGKTTFLRDDMVGLSYNALMTNLKGTNITLAKRLANAGAIDESILLSEGFLISLDKMVAHFIDAGQADATLLIGPDFTILIDAGRHDRNDIVPYLRNVGVTDIDILIGTHPHADHIGQMDKVIESFNVKEVWMSGDVHTTQAFERTIDAIAASNADYFEPRAGDNFEIGSLIIEILSPTNLTGDFHEGSISLRAVYGDIAFIFTGDTEAPIEFEMINSGRNLKAQILQLGHHGSRTSNTQEFLIAVSPEVAIYSAGTDNSYGHPHQEVIDRVKSMGITLYGTDVHGNILITTDGASYSVATSKNGNITGGNGSSGQQPEPIQKPEPQPSENADCPPGSIRINSGSAEELKGIMHISDNRAQQIINLRQQSPFTSYSDMRRISGIGDVNYKDIEAQGIVCFE